MDEKTRGSLAGELFFAGEAANYLSVSQSALEGFISSGRIRPLKRNAEGMLFLKEDLDAVAAELRERSKPATVRGKTEDRKPFDLADRHTQRAINYFVLQSFYNFSDEAAEPAFRKASAQFDMAEPAETFATNLKNFMGDETVTEEEILRRSKRISESFALLRKGDLIIGKDMEEYPAQLKAQEQAPPYLFMRGNPELLSERIVAITGDEGLEEAGRQQAADLSKALGEAGMITACDFDTEISSAVRSAVIQSRRRPISVIPVSLALLSEEDRPLEQTGEQGLIVSPIPPNMKKAEQAEADAVLLGISDASVRVERAGLALVDSGSGKSACFTKTDELFARLEEARVFKEEGRKSIFMKGLKVGYVYNDK